MKNFPRHFLTGVIGVIIGISVTFTTIVVAEKATPSKNKSTLPIDEVQRFTAALQEIKNYYVDNVSDQKLFENALRGMLEGLDPHSAYLDKDEYNDLTSMTKGEFSGIGLEVTLDDGLLKVVSPIDDSPAQIAGIKSGDIIISIDETPVRGMSLKDAVGKMRGSKGTNVTLTIIRKGEEKPLKFTITRNVVAIKSVKSKLLDNYYGYIRISNFEATTANNLQAAIAQLKQQSGDKLKGFILDLRNNPGGLLDSAIDVADVFIDSKNNIVYTKGRAPGSSFQGNATPGDLTSGIPIVVIINGGSASASEIVAGALQDYNRAILVGETSFGKGSVQTVIPLDDETGIKITTALYFTPKGRSIQAEGIIPDVIIKPFDLSNSKVNNDNLDMIKEANLPKHLSNGNDNGKNNSNVNSSDDNLAKTDYQLFEALNLLKGLVVYQNTSADNQLTKK